MKPNKQILYIPRLPTMIHDSLIVLPGGSRIEGTEGYFFTPEQLNEYTQHVINQTLETAAEEAICSSDERGLICFIYKESITDTFEETFNKFKV